MIYAEWTLFREFNNGIFKTWDEYNRPVFNPDINVLLVKIIR